MPWGVVEVGESLRGVAVKASKSGRRIAEEYLGDAAGFTGGGAALGMSLSQFTIATVVLPAMSKKERAETVALQIAYHLPYDPEAADVTHRIVDQGDSNLLLIVAVPRCEQRPWSAIVPAPVALYGLASAGGFLSADESALLVFREGDEVVTVAVEEGGIVFMRSFRYAGDMARELRLCAQAVYLTRERRLLDPDRVLLFGQAREDAVEAAAAFSAEPVAVAVADAVAIAGADVAEDRLDEADWLFPVGLALCDRGGEVANWNVRPRQFRLDNVRQVLTYSAPLLPLLLVGLLYGSTLVNRERARGLREEIAQQYPTLSEVNEMERNVLLMERFLQTTGRDMASPQVWFELLDTLERARPVGLGLTSIAGGMEGPVILSGQASNYSRVTEYMNLLGEASRIEELKLVFARVSADGGADFQMTFMINTELELGAAEEEMAAENESEPAPGAGAGTADGDAPGGLR